MCIRDSADPEGAIRQIGSEQVDDRCREWRMRQFVEQAFVPDFIEGFAHIQQDGACFLMIVGGVG